MSYEEERKGPLAMIKGKLVLLGVLLAAGAALWPVGALQQGTEPERAVVRVQPLEPRKPPATGFLISPDGYILTAAHVVCGSTQFRVRLEGDDSPGDDPQQWRVAQLVPLEEVQNPLIERDLALLKIEPQEGEELLFLKLGDSSRVERGDAVKVIGYPSTLQGIQATTQGTVTNTGQSRSVALCDRVVQLENLIVTDVEITGGNSGGPMLKRNERTGEEEVIGMVNALVGGGLALASPINSAIEALAPAPIQPPIPSLILPPYPPEITRMKLPAQFYQGDVVEGNIQFWDPNADVIHAFVEVLGLPEGVPADKAPQVNVRQCCPPHLGKVAGEIPFTVIVPPSPAIPQELGLQVELLDLAGNLSEKQALPFVALWPKPVIEEIRFAEEIPADGDPRWGAVVFKDPNAAAAREVLRATFRQLAGPPVVIDPPSKAMSVEDLECAAPEEPCTTWELPFSLAAREPGRVTVKVILEDPVFTEAAGAAAEQTFSFSVQPAGVLTVKPKQLEFEVVAGGPDPEPQSLIISNDGAGLLRWQAFSRSTWICLEPPGCPMNVLGKLAAGEFTSVRISINVEELLVSREKQGKIIVQDITKPSPTPIAQHEIPVIVRLTGGHRPNLREFQFPASGSPRVKSGTWPQGLISFEDPDGDIVRVIIGGDVAGFDFDPNVQGQTSGWIEFAVQVRCDQQADLVIEATLEDSRGFRSDTMQRKFTCIP